jgi:hypothetical protein
MTILHRLDKTIIAKIRDSRDLQKIIVDFCGESETTIVKPNWVSADPGDYTEADTLRSLFESLDSRIVVTESLHIGRSLNLNKGKSFMIEDREVNWSWLLKGEGWNWLIENPEWGWFKKEGHWEQILEEDKAYLDRYGFSDLFDDFNVNYINCTDEVWNKRFADPVLVKKVVESQYNPVKTERLYEMIPQKLFNLKGSTFISLARLKNYASFTLKNMFGMIIDPMRCWWHGRQNSRIASSIVDINKIYHSFFNMCGICEALNATAVPDPKGQYQGLYTGRYSLLKDLDIITMSRDLVSLDSILLHLSKPWIRINEKVNLNPIKLAAKEGLGKYDEEVLKEAELKAGDWFSILL